MKLRIRGNSIRLRLTRGEVAEVAERGRVEDAIAFAPGQRLVYVLACGDGDRLRARLDGARVEVTAPSAEARAWASSAERVGMEAEQPLEGGEVLRILVEKDFACLRPRKGEDDRDAFENPHDACD
jgi:hypothetical protein